MSIQGFTQYLGYSRQTPLEAARAELQEEVGGHSENWTYLGPLYTANVICNEIGHIFIAEDIQLHAPAHEPAEIIEIYQKPIADVLSMAQKNEINDGSSALALLLCQNHLGEYL